MEDNSPLPRVMGRIVFRMIQVVLQLLCPLFLLLFHELTSDQQALEPGGWGPLPYLVARSKKQ